MLDCYLALQHYISLKYHQRKSATQLSFESTRVAISWKSCYWLESILRLPYAEGRVCEWVGNIKIIPFEATCSLNCEFYYC